MNYWKIATPELLLFGSNKADDLFDALSDLKFKKPFLVIDPQVKKTQKGKKLSISIKKIGGEIFDQISTNPNTAQVNHLSKKLSNFCPDVIVGIGGGSTIDASKASNLTYTNGGIIQDYLNGKKSKKPLLPMIFLPTTAGTGSEASPFAVIKDDQQTSKRGIENYQFLPKLVILDPNFLSSLSSVLIAATGIDALTHIVESYLSKKANDITRSSAKGLLNNIICNLEKAVFKRDNKSFLKMMNAAFTSRLLYPRTGLTIAHALSHPLSAFTNIHHGLAVAFFLKESLLFNEPYCHQELRNISSLLGFKNTNSFYKWLDNFFIKSKITSEIHEYLLDKNPPIKQMAVDTMKSSNIPSNPREVTEKNLKTVIKKSFKYWGLNETRKSDT